MRDEVLKQVEFYLDQVILWDFPEGFRSVDIYFDGNKKPVHFFNGSQQLVSKETGILFSYAADPRNLHDREVFTVLMQSGIFNGFETSAYGYDGKTCKKHFGTDKKAVMDLLQKIFSAAGQVTDPLQYKIHFSGLYGPQQKAWVIVD